MRGSAAGSAKIFINKLAAAERQLNAAIRMVLAGEDELAIHTVAAAVYRIMRDIKESRGRSDAMEIYNRAIYQVADDLATGNLAAMPTQIAGTPFANMVELMRQHIESGRIKSWEDVPPFEVRGERQFWEKFNRPANFLKHADKDAGRVLNIGELNNHELIMRAGTILHELLRRPTPETFVYGIYMHADYPELWLGSEEDRLAFVKLAPARKRRACLAMIRREKRRIRSGVGGWLFSSELSSNDDPR